MRLAFYKGTRPGAAGVYNRGVRVVTKGKYSHCEAIFSDGMSASASFADAGVRFKLIVYDPAHWDFIEIPDVFEPRIRKWFEDHDGDLYDVLGNVHFLVPFVGDSKFRWCCSEALGAAIGLIDAWRFHPNSLYAILKTFEQLNQWEGLACQTQQNTSSILQALVEPSQHLPVGCHLSQH
jgi:hypothetical protein